MLVAEVAVIIHGKIWGDNLLSVYDSSSVHVLSDQDADSPTRICSSDQAGIRIKRHINIRKFRHNEGVQWDVTLSRSVALNEKKQGLGRMSFLRRGTNQHLQSCAYRLTRLAE